MHQCDNRTPTHCTKIVIRIESIFQFAQHYYV